MNKLTTPIQTSVVIISAKISEHLCLNAVVLRPLSVMKSIYVTFTETKYLITFITYRKSYNVAFNITCWHYIGTKLKIIKWKLNIIHI